MKPRIDSSKLTIGSDNNFDQSLLKGFIALSRQEGKEMIVPTSFAHPLLCAGMPYSRRANDKWLADTLAGSDAPKEIHVFHTNAVNALRGCHQVSCASFNAAYKGKHEASYREILAAIDAGYCHVVDTGHGIALTRAPAAPAADM